MRVTVTLAVGRGVKIGGTMHMMQTLDNGEEEESEEDEEGRQHNYLNNEWVLNTEYDVNRVRCSVAVPTVK